MGAILLAIASAAVAMQRVWGGGFLYTVWADRELTRSAVPFASLPTMGPELSYGVGARIPGGGLHVMWWLAAQLTKDPLGVWRVQVTLDALAATLLGAVVARRFGLFAGVVTAASFLAADPDAVNQSKLWNPAWMSIFIALALSAWVRAVADLEARAVTVFVVSVAASAQMHVTGWLLLPALFPSILSARIPRVGQAFAWGGLGALALYAPYLVSELRQGGPNTALILHPTQLGDATGWMSPDARPFQTVLDMLWALSSVSSLQELSQSMSKWAVVVGVTAPLLIIGALYLLGDADTEHAAPRRRVVSGLLLAIVIEGVAFARAQHFAFQDTDSTRYLIALTPVAAALVGVTAAGAIRAARAWGPIASSLVVALVVSSTGVRLAAVANRTVRGGHEAMSWPRLSIWLDATRKVTGWSGPELAGRLVVSRGERDGWVRQDATPVDAILGPGQGFSGSWPPPCAVLFSTQRPLAVSGMLADSVLAATLGPSVDRPTLDRTWDLMPGVALALYHPATGRCPTSMSQRYVLTPDEEILRDVSDKLPVHGAVQVKAPQGHARWVAVLDVSGGRDPEQPLPVMIDVAWSGDQLTATFTSNGLRGRAWNRGFFADGSVLRPRLEIDSDQGEHGELVIEPGVVGGGGALTPLSATATMPVRGKLRLLVDVALRQLDGAPPLPLVTASVDLP